MQPAGAVVICGETSNFPAVQRARGFTLIEIALSIFILLLLLMLAVPSFTGVIANRRLKQSLDEFNNLVRQAEERSVTERRSYLIVWGKNNVVVRPEVFAEDEEVKAKAEFRPREGSTLRLALPVALAEKYPAEWIFWPSGTCEPATVRFQGPVGSWTASYSALTGRPEITNYAVR
jgi:prepilin-type N-terminal cleavage/methylation domain-containing protein